MSIIIQNELVKEIEQIFTQNIQLKWCEFVDKVVGDNDHFLSYLPLLKCIPAMDQPFELMVQFNTLRGQFAASEQKMSNLLTDVQFTDGQDYCTIDVDNEKFTESLMFISYNCLKLFVMDTQDTKMIRALILAEQMYSMYKPYGKTFLKKHSPKTHYMIIEQTKDFGCTIARYVKSMDNPKKIIVCVSGTLLNMQKFIEDDLNKHSERWGKVIVPLTKAIFATALDDTSRIAKHLTETYAVPYKARMRIEMKEKKQKVPTDSVSWGYIARSGFMIVNSNNPMVPFTHEDFVQCIKEYFVNTLAQKHVSIRDFTHTEYLDCIKELEEERIKKSGYFSAIKANTIYFNEILDARKALKKEEADAKKAAKLGTTGTVRTTIVSTPNGYETNGSESESATKSDKKVDEEESKPAEKTKSSGKKTTKRSAKIELKSDETEEKAEKTKSSTKKTTKSSKKIELISDESDQELEKKSTRRTKKTEKHSEEESKPAAKKPSKVKPVAPVGSIDHTMDSDSDVSVSIETKRHKEEEEVCSDVSDNDEEDEEEEEEEEVEDTDDDN